MSKLDQYAELVERKREFFQTCIRKAGPWSLVPTNKGGIILNLGDKDVKADISIKELTELRDVIDCFLAEVAR